MKKSLFVATALAALIAGSSPALCGENDVGLKASGNAIGDGGGVTVKDNVETNGSAVGIDTAARADGRRAATGVNRDSELKVIPKRPTLGEPGR